MGIIRYYKITRRRILKNFIIIFSVVLLVLHLPLVILLLIGEDIVIKSFVFEKISNVFYFWLIPTLVMFMYNYFMLRITNSNWKSIFNEDDYKELITNYGFKLDSEGLKGKYKCYDVHISLHRINKMSIPVIMVDDGTNKKSKVIMYIPNELKKSKKNATLHFMDELTKK